MFPLAGIKTLRGILRVSDKEVPLMEHFLRDVLAAIVAGIIVAWIVKRFINR
jgi:hypothetical protein